MLVGVMMDALRLVFRRAMGRGGPPVRSDDALLDGLLLLGAPAAAAAEDEAAAAAAVPFMPEEATVEDTDADMMVKRG